MEDAIKNYEDVDSWKTVIFLYNAAMKEVGTKLEILNDEFQHVHKYNPIEHIKTRIKTPESIVILSRCLLQILNHCQRRAAHFRFQAA